MSNKESQTKRGKSSRERLFELIEKNWARNKDVPHDEIEREIEQAIREVRSKK